MKYLKENLEVDMTYEKSDKKEKIKAIVKYIFKVIEVVLAFVGLFSAGNYIYENLIMDADIVIGDNVSVENNYDTSTNLTVYTYSKEESNKYNATEILILADYSYRKGNYDTAFSLYNLSQVKNSDIALCNKAYMYEHGLGVEKDIEKAIECLKATKIKDAKRYLLSLYLLYYDDKQQQCIKLIDDLVKNNDELTLKYITLQNYGMTLDEFRKEYGENATIKYDLDCFQSWEYVGEEDWVDEVPQDYPGIKYIFEKIHYGSNELSENYIGYIYKKYMLKNIDLITNKFIKI